MAKSMVGFTHIEADQYFTDADGRYTFKPELLKFAHEDCLERTELALSLGFDVVVANTFTQLWEMEPYLALAAEYSLKPRIVVATGNYQNIHGCPPEKIEQMRQRWQSFEGNHATSTDPGRHGRHLRTPQATGHLFGCQDP